MTTTTDMAVANEIARQIGGRAFYMMGTQHKVGEENALTFDIRGSRAVNKVRVILDGDDTYSVEFWKIPGPQGWANGKVPVIVHKSEGIYNDGLHQCIESNTGIYLSL